MSSNAQVISFHFISFHFISFHFIFYFLIFFYFFSIFYFFIYFLFYFFNLCFLTFFPFSQVPHFCTYLLGVLSEDDTTRGFISDGVSKNIVVLLSQVSQSALENERFFFFFPLNFVFLPTFFLPPLLLFSFCFFDIFVGVFSGPEDAEMQNSLLQTLLHLSSEASSCTAVVSAGGSSLVAKVFFSFRFFQFFYRKNTWPKNRKH